MSTKHFTELLLREGNLFSFVLFYQHYGQLRVSHKSDSSLFVVYLLFI